MPKFTETHKGSVNHIQIRPNPLANWRSWLRLPRLRKKCFLSFWAKRRISLRS